MRRLATMFMAVAMLLALALPASAHTYDTYDTYDPTVDRTANPAQTCKTIPLFLDWLADELDVALGDYDEPFAHCVSKLATQSVNIPGFGNPWQQCELMGLPYPYTFYDGYTGFDDIFPDLVARNDRQCGNALYAYHTIVTRLPEEPPA